MMQSLWQTQRRSTACGLLSGVFLVTAVVLSRRISGDASTFPSELAACLTGLATSLVAILAASVANLISDRLLRPQKTLLVSACGIPGVMLGLAVMPPGSSTGLACLLGLYLAAVLTVSALDADGMLPTAFPVNRSQAEPPDSSDDSAVVLNGAIVPNDAGPFAALVSETPNASVEPLFERPLAEPAALSETIELAEAAALPFELHEPMLHPGSNPETTQWMSRSTVEGLDVAEGAFRVRFAAGQRLAPVHLPFSPPLADTPEFECESADGADLRFRTTAVHAYGIRIEVSRSADCDQAATTEVAWMASAALNESVAA
jgi:hypothetical protein